MSETVQGRTRREFLTFSGGPEDQETSVSEVGSVASELPSLYGTISGEPIGRREFFRRSGAAMVTGALGRNPVGSILLKYSERFVVEESGEGEPFVNETGILHEASMVQPEKEQNSIVEAAKAFTIAVAIASTDEDARGGMVTATKAAGQWVKDHPKHSALLFLSATSLAVLSGCGPDGEEETEATTGASEGFGTVAAQTTAQAVSTQAAAGATREAHANTEGSGQGPVSTPEATNTPESTLTPEEIRILGSLKTQQEWDEQGEAENGQRPGSTFILDRIQSLPEDDHERLRLLYLLKVMTAENGGDVIDFAERGVVEFWEHNDEYEPNAENIGQWVIRVNGKEGASDQDTGKVYLWNWVGVGAESDPDVVLASDKQNGTNRAAQLGRLTLTPEEGEVIIQAPTREVKDGEVVEHYMSAVSIDPGTNERSKWTDKSGINWIIPEKDEDIVHLGQGEESHFYRLQPIQTNGETPPQEDQGGPIYFEGEALPPKPPVEGLLLDELVEEGKTNAVLVEVDGEDMHVRYELATSPDGSQRVWEPVATAEQVAEVGIQEVLDKWNSGVTEIAEDERFKLDEGGGSFTPHHLGVFLNNNDLSSQIIGELLAKSVVDGSLILYMGFEDKGLSPESERGRFTLALNAGEFSEEAMLRYAVHPSGVLFGVGSTNFQDIDVPELDRKLDESLREIVQATVYFSTEGIDLSLFNEQQRATIASLGEHTEVGGELAAYMHAVLGSSISDLELPSFPINRAITEEDDVNSLPFVGGVQVRPQDVPESFG